MVVNQKTPLTANAIIYVQVAPGGSGLLQSPDRKIVSHLGSRKQRARRPRAPIGGVRLAGGPQHQAARWNPAVQVYERCGDIGFEFRSCTPMNPHAAL